MFDAPPQKKARQEWHLNLDLDSEPWSVGLVVGPSGSGKSSVVRHLWGEAREYEWNAPGVVDDFSSEHSVQQIADVCQAVGFNTIPAWLRPHAVLSNGEKFRVDLARRLLESDDPIIADEFTSVVDRQIAQIASNAVQKYVRRVERRFVAATCHYDVIDWLQPDWMIDMATCSFQRRRLQRRPAVECVVGRLPRSAWSLFAPYHYLTNQLHKGAACFGLWANGRLASFCGIVHCPISRGGQNDDGDGEGVWRISRLVTLPDWQGMGLALALCDVLGQEYRAAGDRLRMYPAHPSLVRAFDRSPQWTLKKKPGRFSEMTGIANLTKHRNMQMGGRPCAIFEYVGPPAPRATLVAEKTLRRALANS